MRGFCAGGLLSITVVNVQNALSIQVDMRDLEAVQVLLFCRYATTPTFRGVYVHKIRVQTLTSTIPAGK